MTSGGRFDMACHRNKASSGRSVRPRKAKYMLSQVGQDQVGGDWGDLVQARFAKLAFNIVFCGEAKAAMCLQAHIGRLPGSICREQFGHVSLCSAGLPGIKEARGLVARSEER